MRHLDWFEKEVKNEYQVTIVVIYAGKYAYTKPNGTHIIPAGLIGC